MCVCVCVCVCVCGHGSDSMRLLRLDRIDKQLHMHSLLHCVAWLPLGPGFKVPTNYETRNLIVNCTCLLFGNVWNRERYVVRGCGSLPRYLMDTHTCTSSRINTTHSCSPSLNNGKATMLCTCIIHVHVQTPLSTYVTHIDIFFNL